MHAPLCYIMLHVVMCMKVKQILCADQMYVKRSPQILSYTELTCAAATIVTTAHAQTGKAQLTKVYPHNIVQNMHIRMSSEP